MKKLFNLICLVIIAGFVHACVIQESISNAPANNNADYQISYLFEHDGCKVYRFNDEGRYVYFTTINSDVMIVPNDSTVITNKVRKQ
jgi:hypothetical protein